MTGWKRRSRADPSRCACGTRRASWLRCTEGTTRHGGLGRLAASTAPSAAPAPDQRMQLVDEQNDAALDSSISLSTAFRRSSNSPRYLSRRSSRPSRAPRAPVLEAFGNSPSAIRRAVLRRWPSCPLPALRSGRGCSWSAGQDLHGAADLVVTSETGPAFRCEPSRSCRGRSASRDWEAVFGVRVAPDSSRAPPARRSGCRLRSAEAPEYLRGLVLAAGDRQQHVLRRRYRRGTP